MTGAYVKCSGCSYSVEAADFAPAGVAHCPGCHRELTAAIFPAMWKPLAAALPDALIATEEASCFYHEANRAAVVCDGCGRFLCKLCDVEVQGQHLCPACIEAGVRKKSVASLDHNRFLYGQFAAALAVVPILFWPATCLTAPAAIFTAIRYWKRPAGVTGTGGHFYNVIAIIFGLVQIVAWTVVIVRLIAKN